MNLLYSGKMLVLVGSHSGEFAAIKLDGKVISLCTLPDRIESSALVSKCGKYFYIGELLTSFFFFFIWGRHCFFNVTDT